MADRENSLEASRAILMNKAVSAVIDKKASSDFKKTIKGMTDDDG